MKYDYGKLLGKMREKGYTQEQIAEKIGICSTSINLKLNGKRHFRQDEIVALCNILEIELRNVEEYFFTHEV